MFEAVSSGRKKFDLRLADFEAASGDMLILEEYDPANGKYTGRTLEKKITFVLQFRLDNYPFASAEELKKHGLQVFSLE